MCFVVKQSWHCCSWLSHCHVLPTSPRAPEWLWMGQNCSLSLGTENFSFQSFCAVKEVPTTWWHSQVVPVSAQSFVPRHSTSLWSLMGDPGLLCPVPWAAAAPKVLPRKVFLGKLILVLIHLMLITGREQLASYKSWSVL